VRAKTDRLDTELLLRGRTASGANLVTEQTRIVNQIKAILTRFGIRTFRADATQGRGTPLDAWRCIGEATRAVETTKETMFETEVYRVAGEIALKSPEPDAAKAEAYFEQALAVSRQQQAKSFELRAVLSLARLWRGQGKVQQARELLAPLYGWFTEGFDTRDLKEAKALMAELS
jgi:predicted ATPase